MTKRGNDQTWLGYVTEVECIAEFMKAGYKVSLPYQQASPYDLIVDDGLCLYKIQVKKAKIGKSYPKKQKDVIHLITGKQNGRKMFPRTIPYLKSEVDYFATMYEGKCYIYPSSQVKGTNTFIPVTDLWQYELKSLLPEESV